MRVESIPFSDLPFSALFKAFVDGSPTLNDFYSHFPADTSALVSASANHTWNGDREALVSILTELNAEFRPHEAAIRNIRRFADPKALAMVTGQQVIAFGGPLFTIYKLITAIVLAGKLEKETGNPVIPVFWMADEDNDYAEVASIGFPSKGQWYSGTLASRTDLPHSAGFLKVSDDVDRLLQEVDEALAPSDWHSQVMDLLRNAYTGGSSAKTHPSAFGELLTRLFSKHGLVLAVSTSPTVKKILAPAMIRYAERCRECKTALESVSAGIAKSYHSQASVGNTLLFEHSDTQGRVRIDAITPEVVERIRIHPERFSPNVFLRPILQDTLLPTLAYIGGPAEVAYYAQMKSFYEVMGAPMPVILPRFSATIIESKIRRFLDESALPWTRFNLRVEDLDAEILRHTDAPDVDGLLETWRGQLEVIHNSQSAWISEVDPTLAASAESVLREQQHALEKLRQKLLRALKQKEETRLRRARQIREALFPNGNLQEREWAMIHVMNRYGLDVWDRLIEAFADADWNRHHLIEP